MAAAEMMTRERRDLLLGGLLLLCLLLNINCAWNGFVYDDHSQIEQNPNVHSFANIGKIFGSGTTSQQGKQSWANSYRPLVNFSFLLSYKAFGLYPYGYHLVNVFLHLIVVALVFLVTSKLFSDDAGGLLVAAIFALHPVHTEPVAWIDGISDPLFAIFYLLAFWFFLRLAQEPPQSAVRLRIAMIACFALALFSKETAMTFPVVVTAFEHFCRTDHAATNWLQKFSRYGWIWATHIVYLAIRAHALGTLSPPPMHPNLTRREIFFSALSLVGEYAKTLVWPVPLVAFEPFRANSSFQDAHVMTGILALGVSLAVFILLWNRARLYVFALFWMYLLLAPALNARWMAANVYADRYLYLPSLGFCWLLGGLIIWAWRSSESKSVVLRWAISAAGVLLALLASSEIVARNREWKNDRTVILATLKACPDAPNMRSDLGMMEWYSGHHAEAERQWLLALTYKPDTVEVLANLGMARLEEKRYDEAIAYLQKAIQLKPYFATPHIHLARVYLAQGKPADAEAEFRRAVEIYPANPIGRKALGHFYLDSGRLPEAEEQFLAAVAVQPDLESWRALGEIYTSENKTEQAEDAWQHALVMEPFDPRAHAYLGRIYLSKGRYVEAQKEFQACMLFDPANKEAIAGMGKLRELARVQAYPATSIR